MVHLDGLQRPAHAHYAAYQAPRAKDLALGPAAATGVTLYLQLHRLFTTIRSRHLNLHQELNQALKIRNVPPSH